MMKKIEAAIERLANSVDDGIDATDALKVTQAVLNLANARGVIHNASKDKSAIALELIGELSVRNDDATYRQAAKEIIEQCDG